MLKFTIPTWLTVILGLVGGILEYLNQASFHLASPWGQVITFGLYAVGVFGVSPLIHNAFRNALHISPQLATVITILLTLLAAAITTFSISADVKGVLEGIVAFAAFVGFGPALGVLPGPAAAPPAV
jgi:hypothetical protein